MKKSRTRNEVEQDGDKTACRRTGLEEDNFKKNKTRRDSLNFEEEQDEDKTT